MDNTNNVKDYSRMENTEDVTLRIPAVAPRGKTVVPGLVVHFDLTRGNSILAVGKTMLGGERVLPW